MFGVMTVSISWCLAVPHKDDSVTALAVDWVTSNLYWSSTERPDLHVTSRYNGYTTSLLQRSLKVKYARAALLTFALFFFFCSSMIMIFTPNIDMAPSSQHKFPFNSGYYCIVLIL